MRRKTEAELIKRLDQIIELLKPKPVKIGYSRVHLTQMSDDTAREYGKAAAKARLAAKAE